MNSAHLSDRDRGLPWLPWLLALGGFAFDLAVYWPGMMSFDSAYAWWQARGGASTDITAPVLVWMWRLCTHLLDGPGLPFAFHLALFWSGLALLTRSLRLTPLATLATVLLVGFAPVPLLLRGHVWTDVGLFSALICATAALARAELGQRRRWLALAIALLFYATALRHNALPAILPLVGWSAWLMFDSRQALDSEWATRRPLKAWPKIGATLALLLGLGIAVNALNNTVEKRVPLWPSLAQFDLAAISVATGEMRLPGFMIGPGLDIADLAQAFRPWSNTPMLQNTRHGMRDPFNPGFSRAELEALRTAWERAIVEEPAAWLAHRWRLTRALFGNHDIVWPVELTYVDAEVQYADNPPVAANDSAIHVGLMRIFATLRATPALAAWPCLLVGLIALPRALRRRHTPAGRVALMLLGSAWLYALPLVLLAPSAELRYLGWPCIASLLAGAIAAFAPRSVLR